MEIDGKPVIFARAERLNIETMNDLLVQEQFVVAVQAHDGQLLTTHLTPTNDGTVLAEGVYHKPRAVTVGKDALLNPDLALFTPVTNGDRPVTSGQSIAEMSKRIFGDIGGIRPGATKETGRLFDRDGPIDKALPSPYSCAVIDGHIFLFDSDEDTRTFVAQDMAVYVNSIEDAITKKRNAHAGRMMRQKAKRPGLVAEIDQLMSVIDHNTEMRLPLLAKLLPALEQADENGRGKRRGA